jgi:hypothetical protein
MTQKINVELMKQLFGEIENAWRNRKDRMLVYQLAEEHPSLRDELYEFFEDLVLGDSDEVSPEVADAEERVARWIQSSGVNIAVEAARLERVNTPATTTSRPGDVNDPVQQATRSQPQTAMAATWVAFLRERVRCTLPDLAKALPNVTVEYLVLVSRHPDKVPRAVCTKLATFVEKCWQVPADESLKYLSTNQNLVVRAASRASPFGQEPVSFEDLLNRAALSQEQKDFWLQYAGSVQDARSR